VLMTALASGARWMARSVRGSRTATVG
jgi:hypothetical protein